MLAACDSSPTDGGVKSAPAPVVERQTVVKLACPVELVAPVAAMPAVPDGALLKGNDAGMAWLNTVLAWGRVLSDRLEDARAACP